MTPDPILLIEVLSPSNANETWENVMAYATLPSVREILVVHSTRTLAEVLRRDTDGNWPGNPELVEAGGTIKLTSIDAHLVLADFYTGTDLKLNPLQS